MTRQTPPNLWAFSWKMFCNIFLESTQDACFSTGSQMLPADPSLQKQRKTDISYKTLNRDLHMLSKMYYNKIKFLDLACTVFRRQILPIPTFFVYTDGP